MRAEEEVRGGTNLLSPIPEKSTVPVVQSAGAYGSLLQRQSEPDRCSARPALGQVPRKSSPGKRSQFKNAQEVQRIRVQTHGFEKIHTRAKLHSLAQLLPRWEPERFREHTDDLIRLPIQSDVLAEQCGVGMKLLAPKSIG